MLKCMRQASVLLDCGISGCVYTRILKISIKNFKGFRNV